MNRKFVLALAFCLFSSTAFTVAPALAAGKIGVASLAQVTARASPVRKPKSSFRPSSARNARSWNPRPPPSTKRPKT